MSMPLPTEPSIPGNPFRPLGPPIKKSKVEPNADKNVIDPRMAAAHYNDSRDLFPARHLAMFLNMSRGISTDRCLCNPEKVCPEDSQCCLYTTWPR